MVQNKKNFSSGKKMTESRELDKKSQAGTAGRSVDSARTGIAKDHAGQSKDKADVAKRDVGSRK